MIAQSFPQHLIYYISPSGTWAKELPPAGRVLLHAFLAFGRVGGTTVLHNRKLDSKADQFTVCQFNRQEQGCGRLIKKQARKY